MSVNSKHVATFLLGAAAALAAHKYMNMTAAEKDKLSADHLKDKANQLKGEAEAAMEKGSAYFDELKTKGADAMKEHFGDVSAMLHNLFGGGAEAGNTKGANTNNTKA